MTPKGNSVESKISGIIQQHTGAWVNMAITDDLWLKMADFQPNLGLYSAIYRILGRW